MFETAAQDRGSHAAVPDALAHLEETLQLLGTAWYQLAADASSRSVEPIRPRPSQAPAGALSREQEVRLLGTLHDVAAAFGRCARVCRDGRATVTPIIARRVAEVQSRELPIRHVA